MIDWVDMGGLEFHLWAVPIFRGVTRVNRGKLCKEEKKTLSLTRCPELKTTWHPLKLHNNFGYGLFVFMQFLELLKL